MDEKKVLNVAVEEETHRWMRHIAAEKGISLKALMEQAITQYAYENWGKKQ